MTNEICLQRLVAAIHWNGINQLCRYGFSLSVFKKTTDSVPGEYYYHTTDGRIDTLFKKEGGKYKPVVSIAYDFLIGQDSYELKKGNHSYFVETGVLIAEEVFPIPLAPDIIKCKFINEAE